MWFRFRLFHASAENTICREGLLPLFSPVRRLVGPGQAIFRRVLTDAEKRPYSRVASFNVFEGGPVIGMLKQGVQVVHSRELNYRLDADNRVVRFKPWLGDAFSFPVSYTHLTLPTN